MRMFSVLSYHIVFLCVFAFVVDVRERLLAIFAHINQRLAALPTCQLPVEQLVKSWQQLQESGVGVGGGNAYVITFTAMYLDRGFRRLPASSPLHSELVPLLLQGIAQRSAAHQKTLLHLFLSSLPHIKYHHQEAYNYTPTDKKHAATTTSTTTTTTTTSSISTSTSTTSETPDVEMTDDSIPSTVLDPRFAFATDVADRRLVLNFITDVLLYAPPYKIQSKADEKKAAAATATTAPTAAATTSATTPAATPEAPAIPDGLSSAAVSLVIPNPASPPPLSTINSWKHDVLTFLSESRIWQDNELLIPSLIGTCIGSEESTRIANDIQRRLKNVDLEDATLMEQLLTLYLGTADVKMSPSTPTEHRRSPVNINIKLRLLFFFQRSLVIVQQSSQVVRVIFDCLFSPISNIKLKQSGLQLLSWLINHADTVSDRLASCAPVLLNGVLKLLQLVAHKKSALGSTLTATELQTGQLRGLVYLIVGQICAEHPTLANRNLKLLQLFFRALGEETDASVLQQITEGLSLLRQAYATASADISQQLLSMLQTLIDGDRRTRLNALQCLNRLYPFEDVGARFICLQLLNDTAVEVRDEARRGLTPFSLRNAKSQDRTKKEQLAMKASNDSLLPDNQVLGNTSTSTPTTTPTASTSPSTSSSNAATDALSRTAPYPDFPSFVAYCTENVTRIIPHANTKSTPVTDHTTDVSTNTPSASDARVLEEVLSFIRKCYQHACRIKNITEAEYAQQLTEDSSPSARTSLTRYQSLIELAFDQNVSSVQQTAAKTLYKLVRARPSHFAPIYAQRLPWLEKFLLGGILGTRQHMARLLILLTPHLDLPTLTSLITRFHTILKPDSAINVTSTSSVVTTAEDAIHGAILGLGVVVAEGIARSQVSTIQAPEQQLLAQAIHAIMSYMSVSTTSSMDPAITAAAALSIGRCGSRGPLPIPFTIDSTTSIPTSTSTSTSTSSTDSSTTEPLSKKHKQDAAHLIYRIYSLTEIIQRLTNLTKGSERKQGRVVEEAVTAMGQLSIGHKSDKRIIRMLLDGLYSTVNLKFEEVHFAVGEALATIGLTDAQVDSVEMKGVIPNDAPPSSTPASDAPVPVSAMTEILRVIISKYLARGSSIQRSASCTWLLNVVKYASTHSLVVSSLSTIQQAFSLALTESDQFIQEVAAKGMSLVYEQSPAATRDTLIDQLADTFTTGTRRVHADTEISIDSERGEFATYKELCTVASEMGQPDLIYKFLDLASHHSIWQSKMGAAFSLGSIVKANAQLAPKLATLIPMLYRYQYDSNAKIRDSMRTMWSTLVADPRTSLNQHFDAIMQHLLKSLSSKQYRARQAACMACCDLISGRGYDQVGKYLAELWAATFRCMDDVNGPVRESAQHLSTSLLNLSIRLCDPKYTGRTDVERSLAIVMPFMLTKGLTERVKEIQSVSIRCVLAVTKVGGIYLRPHLADLCASLLEGMSTLEPATFSYLQFHARSMEMTEEQIEAARLSISRNSPLSDALQQCLHVMDQQALTTVVPKLMELLKAGLGLPTLTAAAKFIISLINSNLGSHMREYSGPLIRTLQSGLLDQSPSIRKVYCTALGYCCRIGKAKPVTRLLESLIEMYMKTEASDTQRLVSGTAMAAAARYAPDQCKAHVTTIAPVAFLASHDPVTEVARVWLDTWEELTPGKESGCLLYQQEIVTCTVNLLEKTSWLHKKAAMISLEELVRIAKGSFSPHVSTVLPILYKALPGRIWVGKEVVVELIVSILISCSSSITPSQVDTAMSHLVTESSRTKTEYKRQALKQLGRLAQHFPHTYCIGQARPLVAALIARPIGTALEVSDEDAKLAAYTPPITSTATATAAATEQTAMAKKDADLSFTIAYTVAGQIWPQPPSVNTIGDSNTTSTPSTATVSAPATDATATAALWSSWFTLQSAHGPWLLDTLLSGLSGAIAWPIRVTILTSLRRYVFYVYLGDSDTLCSDIPAQVIRPSSSLFTPTECTRVLQAILMCTRDGKFVGVRTAGMEVLVTLLSRPAAYVTWKTPSENSMLIADILLGVRDDQSHNIIRLREQAKQLVEKANK